jgi:hypothetical protein
VVLVATSRTPDPPIVVPGLPPIGRRGCLVVVGVDGTASGQHALQAARLAGDAGLLGLDAQLLAVHVQAPSPAWWASPAAGATLPTVALEPAWRDALELAAFTAAVTMLGGGLLPWRFTVEFGDAGAVLARYRAEGETRLVVVGRRVGRVPAPRRWWHRCPARRLAAAAGADLAPVYVVAWTASDASPSPT